jgi:cytoplasmic iron level regulating protein YaaA (DUF328/UPF0246 family)
VNWRQAFSFGTTLVMELIPGRRLEVLWELGESTKKTKVWWGAIVTKTSRRALTTSPQSAMVRYDAMHGYEATDSKVIFINSTMLEESEGRTKSYVTFGAGLKRLAANPETEFRFQRRNQQMFLILMTYITRSI